MHKSMNLSGDSQCRSISQHMKGNSWPVFCTWQRPKWKFGSRTVATRASDSRSSSPDSHPKAAVRTARNFSPGTSRLHPRTSQLLRFLRLALLRWALPFRHLPPNHLPSTHYLQELTTSDIPQLLRQRRLWWDQLDFLFQDPFTITPRLQHQCPLSLQSLRGVFHINHFLRS